MFNWVYRVLMLAMFCGLGVMFYVNRASYTLDQFGFFTCVWLCIIGVLVFLRDIADDLKVGRLADAETEKKLWQKLWLDSREEFRRLELRRCPRDDGWLVREWPGYFLREDSYFRCDWGTGINDQAYSLFRVEPYGLVEVFVGKFEWVLGQCEKAIVRDRELTEKAVELSNDSRSVKLRLADKIMECAFPGVGDVDPSKVYSGNHDLVNETDDVPDNLLHHFMDLNGVNDMTIDEFKTSGVSVGVIDTNDHVVRDGFRDFTTLGSGGHNFCTGESKSVDAASINGGLEAMEAVKEPERVVGHTIWDSLRDMNQKIYYDIISEEDKKAWDAILKASKKTRAEDDGVFEREHQNEVPTDRCKFLGLPVGSKFRYVGLDTVFVKLGNRSQRGEKIGLITKFEGFDVPKFIETGDYLGCDKVFCAADTVEACESLVVCVVE